MHTITDELLTRKDLMAIFKVSQPTILRLEAAGKLQPIRLGTRVRFKRSDVEQYIQDSHSR